MSFLKIMTGTAKSRMFADIHHFVAAKEQFSQLIMSADGQHHFEGYTRADGGYFDGG